MGGGLVPVLGGSAIGADVRVLVSFFFLVSRKASFGRLRYTKKKACIY